MILFLRGFFIVVLGSMLAVTSWASFQCPLFAIPGDVATHPWFLATLLDAYWGFLTFFLWVCWKETGALSRVAWFVAVLLLGNIAMAAYCLKELFSVPLGHDPGDLLVRRNRGPGRFGIFLAVLGAGVVAGAWFSR